MVKKYVLLSNQQREELCTLIHRDGLTIKEAARRTGIPYPNAKAVNKTYERERRTEKRHVKLKSNSSLSQNSGSGSGGIARQGMAFVYPQKRGSGDIIIDGYSPPEIITGQYTNTSPQGTNAMGIYGVNGPQGNFIHIPQHQQFTTISQSELTFPKYNFNGPSQFIDNSVNLQISQGTLNLAKSLPIFPFGQNGSSYQNAQLQQTGIRGAQLKMQNIAQNNLGSESLSNSRQHISSVPGRHPGTLSGASCGTNYQVRPTGPNQSYIKQEIDSTSLISNYPYTGKRINEDHFSQPQHRGLNPLDPQENLTERKLQPHSQSTAKSQIAMYPESNLSMGSKILTPQHQAFSAPYQQNASSIGTLGQPGLTHSDASRQTSTAQFAVGKGESVGKGPRDVSMNFQPQITSNQFLLDAYEKNQCAAEASNATSIHQQDQFYYKTGSATGQPVNQSSSSSSSSLFNEKFREYAKTMGLQYNQSAVVGGLGGERHVSNEKNEKSISIQRNQDLQNLNDAKRISPNDGRLGQIKSGILSFQAKATPFDERASNSRIVKQSQILISAQPREQNQAQNFQTTFKSDASSTASHLVRSNKAFLKYDIKQGHSDKINSGVINEADNFYSPFVNPSQINLDEKGVGKNAPSLETQILTERTLLNIVENIPKTPSYDDFVGRSCSYQLLDDDVLIFNFSDYASQIIECNKGKRAQLDKFDNNTSEYIRPSETK
ncbi:hypothetical protein FGO68_gene3140 [Halteria grandinella]|uniref:Uncharacterized protein n=1 Tax=Halteria grandinella TaxID=5974 RepID=A0A8J8NFY9_HALGN|nr:hypothetical protein FGO68_gene3140 [Halteria grandinella]